MAEQAGVEEEGTEPETPADNWDGDIPPPPPSADQVDVQEVNEIPSDIFRAYDIRGNAAMIQNSDLAVSIGRAIGSEAHELGQKEIVVGRDGRNSSPELSKALIEGIRASGLDVIDIGQAPTPVVFYATDYLNTGSAVVVTASHNPKEDNGFKIMLDGKTLSEDAITRIYTRLESGDFQSGEGNLQHVEVDAEYIRRVSEDVPVSLGNAFKIVVDCGNGVAGSLAPRLYRALGHDVVELHCDIDGNFPNHHPDPSQPGNMADLVNAVRAEEADIGLAFDGDGDRLGVVDNQGNIIWADRVMMLFARDVLAKNTGSSIVYDVKCTDKLGLVIKKLGGQPVMWRTGHSLIRAKMQETDAQLAGDLSGHFFFQDRWYGYDDALYAGARLLEILQSLGGSAAEMFEKLPGVNVTPEILVPVEQEKLAPMMARIAESGDAFGDANLLTIDGIRAEYPDGWGLVRASNTTSVLTMRFEGKDEAALQRIQAQFKTVLQGVEPGLNLPF